MQMNLDSEILINATFRGKTYQLREPTVQEIHEFQKKSEASNPEVALLEFLDTIGLPKDVSGDIGITKLRTLTEQLTGAVGKK